MNKPQVQKMPTAAYVFSLAGGIFGLLLTFFFFIGALIGGIAIYMGFWTLITSILIIVFARKLKANPMEHSKWGVLIFIFSILSILGLFAIIGGILALLFNPNLASQSYVQRLPITEPKYDSPQYFPQQYPSTPIRFCKNCGISTSQLFNFCPNCGSRKESPENKMPLEITVTKNKPQPEISSVESKCTQKLSIPVMENKLQAEKKQKINNKYECTHLNVINETYQVSGEPRRVVKKCRDCGKTIETTNLGR